MTEVEQLKAEIEKLKASNEELTHIVAAVIMSCPDPDPNIGAALATGIKAREEKLKIRIAELEGRNRYLENRNLEIQHGWDACKALADSRMAVIDNVLGQCHDARVQIYKLREALEFGMQISDGCSRGYLEKFYALADSALAMNPEVMSAIMHPFTPEDLNDLP